MDDEWECPDCYAENDDERTECYNCGRERT